MNYIREAAKFLLEAEEELKDGSPAIADHHLSTAINLIYKSRLQTYGIGKCRGK